MNEPKTKTFKGDSLRLMNVETLMYQSDYVDEKRRFNRCSAIGRNAEAKTQNVYEEVSS